MALAPLPEEILDRFRTSSRNRLAQVASTWQAATIGHATEAMLVEMHRNVHTLKGDARMVQFLDIDLVCQKLEDLLAAAGEHQYRVTSDVDLSVSMALDFIGLLLRRRGDQQVSGIDLDGFVAQVHEALLDQASHKRRIAQPSTLDAGTSATLSTIHLSEQSRGRLACAATNVFLEYLSASGVARTRLRGVWRELQHELDVGATVSLATIAERHVVAARALASELGQKIVVESSLPSNLRATTATAQALDVAFMHSVRNALSHGLSAPSDSRGMLTIDGSSEGEMLLFHVRDNGRGIDVEEVRRSAVRSDRMHPDVAKTASRKDLLKLLFESHFTTRDQADDISGRGLGLDVVRAAIQKVGGDVSIDGKPGAGAVLTIRVPIARREIEIHVFDAYGGRIALGVPATWTVQSIDLSSSKEPIDPLHRLQVRRPKDVTGLVQAGPPQILRFEGEGVSMDLVAAKPARLVRARRICPTPGSFPAEVVTVDGAEVLLLRPDNLPPAITKKDGADHD